MLIRIGFYRRNRYSIEPEYDRPRTVTDDRPSRRKGPLQSHGYNIINGSNVLGSFDKTPHSRKYLADIKSERLLREGAIALRDSMNRFYMYVS